MDGMGEIVLMIPSSVFLSYMVNLGRFDDDDDDDVVCVSFFLSGFFPTFQKKKLEQEKNSLLILEKFQMKKME